MSWLYYFVKAFHIVRFSAPIYSLDLGAVLASLLFYRWAALKKKTVWVNLAKSYLIGESKQFRSFTVFVWLYSHISTLHAKTKQQSNRLNVPFIATIRKGGISQL